MSVHRLCLSVITIEEADVRNLKGKVFSAHWQELFRIFHHVLSILHCLLYIAVSIQQQQVSLRVVDVDWVLSNGGHHLYCNFKILLGFRVLSVVKRDIS